MEPITRRQFLIVAGGGALAATLASCAPGAPSATPLAASPGASSAGAMADAIVPAPNKIVITPQSELYQQNYSDVPAVSSNDWQLKMDGLVDSPLNLDLAALKALPQYSDVRTLECIGNPVGGNLVGNVKWEGALLKDALAKIKIDPKATHVNFQAADGYFTSVSLDWITQPGTMLAYGMNGEPLMPEHGYPLRILMPGLYGQKMPKWIEHIEFTDKPVYGFWESQGWSNTASVQTNSKFVFPGDGDRLAGGILPVYGIAFAGMRKITKVEVSFDGKTWIAAKLIQAASPLVWTQWSVDWPASMPGNYRLQVRATDETGFVQNSYSAALLGSAYPDGTSDIHNIGVQIEG